MKMIKNVICGLFMMIVFFCIIGCAGYIESTYHIRGKVLNQTNGIWAIEDSRGEIWEYESKTLAKGEDVTITFFDNHTYGIYDDEIIKVKVLKNHN